MRNTRNTRIVYIDEEGKKDVQNMGEISGNQKSFALSNFCRTKSNTSASGFQILHWGVWDKNRMD